MAVIGELSVFVPVTLEMTIASDHPPKMAGEISDRNGAAVVLGNRADGIQALLHATADLARMKAKVAAGAQPWTAGWNRLVANAHAALTWTPRPAAIVYRGANGTNPENYAQLFNDDLVDICHIFAKPGHPNGKVALEQYAASKGLFTTDKESLRKFLSELINRVYLLAYLQQIIVGRRLR